MFIAPTRFYRAHETARAEQVDGLQLAGFIPRAIGFGIDFILISWLRKPVEFLYQEYAPHGWERHTAIDLVHVRSLIVLILYFSLALYIGSGRTVGKLVTGTRVLSLTHGKVTLWQSIERALGYGASFLEAGFGFAQFFINRNRQCVHDRIAETIVVNARDISRQREAGSVDEDSGGTPAQVLNVRAPGALVLYLQE